jgi:hypothetical protein
MPNIIMVIKSRTIIWAGHTAYVGQMRRVGYIILVAIPEGKIILK